MAEEVEIIGVDGGPASEATLKRILDEMKRRKSSNNQARRFQDLYNEALRKGTRTVSDFDDQIDKTTESVKTLGDRIGSVANIMKIGVGGALMGLSKELLMGGNRIGDFAKHLPFVGDQLGALGKFIDNQVDMYRDLSNTGANFNNSLIDMNKEAIAAGMGLGRFIEIIGANSERMAFFGTNVAGGARAFGQLQKQLRGGILGEQLFSMGFTINDINEGLINYTQQQARLGRLEGMTQSELIAGSQNYLKEIDKLARITGVNRKQQEQIMLQNAAEANVAAMMSKLDEKGQKNFNANLNMMAAALPGYENAFKDLADGVAQTDLGQKLQALSPEFAQLARDAATGRVGQAEFDTRMKELIPRLTKFRDEMGAAGVTALSDQSAGFSALFGSMYQFEEYMKKTFNDKEAAKAQARRDALTSLGTQFESAVELVRASLLNTLIKNKTFDNIKKLFDETFEEGSMSAFTDNIAKFMKEFTEDPTGKIKEVFQDFKDFLFGSVDYDKNGMEMKQRGLFEHMGDAFSDFWNSEKVQSSIDTFLDNIAYAFEYVLRKTWDNIAPSWLGGKDTRLNDILSNATSGEIKTFEESYSQNIPPAKFSNDRDLNKKYAAFVQQQRLLDKEILDEITEKVQKGLGFPGYNKGTKGFEDFGKGTLAMLHNREAVIPLNSKLGQSLNALMEPSQSQRVEIPTKSTENINILGLPPMTNDQMKAIATRSQRDDIKKNLEQLNNTMMQVVGLLQQNSKENREINSSLKKMRGIVY